VKVADTLNIMVAPQILRWWVPNARILHFSLQKYAFCVAAVTRPTYDKAAYLTAATEGEGQPNAPTTLLAHLDHACMR
jgi:hypothetical protein